MDNDDINIVLAHLAKASQALSQINPPGIDTAMWAAKMSAACEVAWATGYLQTVQQIERREYVFARRTEEAAQ